MKTRQNRTVLAVVAGVLALLLLAVASQGADAAAGLTAKSVKRIATTVVKQKSKGLSVAHAASADSATTATTASTAGRADAADRADTAKRADTAAQATRADVAGRVTAYRYLLPVTTLSSQHRYDFPSLPDGTYQATYYIYAAGVTASSILACELESNGTAFGETLLTPNAGVGTTATVFVTSRNGSVTVNCSSPGAGRWDVIAMPSSEVDFVPVNETLRTAGASTS
jgi:hypothetical protein